MPKKYRPFRIAFLLLASLSLELRARAELEVIEDAEGQQGLTVHRMTVTPAAEPMPALKHRFTDPTAQTTARQRRYTLLTLAGRGPRALRNSLASVGRSAKAR